MHIYICLTNEFWEIVHIQYQALLQKQIGITIVAKLTTSRIDLKAKKTECLPHTRNVLFHNEFFSRATKRVLQ